VFHVKHPASIELIARGVLLSGTHLLLCRSVKRGHSYLPGGHVEPGETAAVALARELMEEAGLAVRVGPPILVMEHLFHDARAPHHELNILFPMSTPSTDPARALSPARPVPTLEPRSLVFQWIDLAAPGGPDPDALGFQPPAMLAWVARNLARCAPAAPAAAPDWLSVRADT
jgi:8-oxo-dGTP pyrophosphatase MutT (NUDIX family)